MNGKEKIELHDELYTVDEAAKLLNISPATLGNKIRKKEIKATMPKEGQIWYIFKSWIFEYVLGRTNMDS